MEPGNGGTEMNRWRYLSVLVLALTAIYLYAFPTATIVYAAAVLLHTGLGVLLVLGLACVPFPGTEYGCVAGAVRLGAAWRRARR